MGSTTLFQTNESSHLHVQYSCVLLLSPPLNLLKSVRESKVNRCRCHAHIDNFCDNVMMIKL